MPAEHDGIVMEGKSRVFKFEDFEVQEREFSLSKKGEVVPVEPKAFRVLLVLLQDSGRLITKNELLDGVWGDTSVTENSLTRAIALLRRLLADDAREPRFIETVTGVGYRFLCPVQIETQLLSSPTEAPDLVATAQGSNPAQEAGPEASRLASGRRTWSKWVIAGTAVILAIALTAIWATRKPSTLHVASYAQITYGGHRMGVWLTDGSRLYLNSDSASGPAEVAVSGGEIVPLKINVPGNGFELQDISPDGTQLLVLTQPSASERYGLWLQSIPGGTVRHLADGWFGSFAPDGKAVLYVSVQGDELDSVNIDVTGNRRLAHVGGGLNDPRWTPDGKHIRFERDGKLWEIAPDGADLHPLLPDFKEAGEQSNGRWSLDGRYYFFLVGGLGGQIWGINEQKRFPWQSKSEPFQLSSGPLHWGVPVPGKDGKTIFATGETDAGELSRLDGKTGTLKLFLNGISAEFASFSRDGKSVAYVSFPEGVLWKANIDGSGRTQLSSPPIYPALPQWSPDGTKILFADLQDFEKPATYIVSSEGGEAPRKLMPNATSSNLDATWSSDGKRIAFHSLNSPGNEDIRVFELSTSRTTVLPGSRGFHSPRWSPDGLTVAALSREAPFLRLYDATAQRWRALNTGGIIGFPCFSHDSKTIYFLRTGTDQGIARIDLSSGIVTKVADLREVRLAGVVGVSMSLDPSDAPLTTRRTGTDDVYALQLAR